MSKNKNHTDKSNDNVKLESTNKSKFRTYGMRFLGVMLIIMSLIVYTQGLPLFIVFVGSYVGVTANSSITNIDIALWGLTCIGLFVPLIYGFLKWIGFLFKGFVKYDENTIRK